MSINSKHVDELVAAGKYADAATAALEAGDPLRAAELFERIWDFAEATKCARQGGDLGRALKNAIDSRNEPLVVELVDELEATGEEGRRTALDVLALRRRFDDAAPLAEALGEIERAIEYYKSAHIDLEAARLLEERGRDREAGQLLERVIDNDDDAPAVIQAQLRLGLLLARRMQHEEAARHLQQASKSDETRARAQRALVVELVALGLRDAARDVLSDARRQDPSLPAELDSFIRDERSVQEHTTGDRDVEIVAGRYKLEQLLGAGASGRVFRARDEVSGHHVAIKMFNTAYARGRQVYERFVREARVTGALHHPNLVEVYDFSAEHGFTVMELMPGGSLAQRLDGPMDESTVVRMATDVLAGLELAHQRGVIHRDVKPANIFFDVRGTAKLGDFGVAHLLDLGQTQTGGLIGTLAYMAPEQITGAKLSITADLYAVGVTLFEALTGRLPFLGPDFVAQHLGEDPPLPTSVRPDLSPEWDDLIIRAMTKDPGSRFESVDAMRRAILAIDLGEAGEPKPLMLPRATSRRRPSVVPASPVQVSDEVEADDDAPRYEFETPIGRTTISQLSRALDTALDRSVIIERFDEDAVDPAIETRLFTLARGGGPFMQRALSYDRPARVAVFEAPTGSPIAEVYEKEALTPRKAARLIKRLARAVATLHANHRAHGSIDATHILIDTHWNPTVLVSGLGPISEEPTPEADIDAILALITKAIHEGEAMDSRRLADRLTAGLSPEERGAVLAMPEPRTAEELYAFGDAIEIALLRARVRTGAL